MSSRPQENKRQPWILSRRQKVSSLLVANWAMDWSKSIFGSQVNRSKLSHVQRPVQLCASQFGLQIAWSHFDDQLDQIEPRANSLMDKDRSVQLSWCKMPTGRVSSKILQARLRRSRHTQFESSRGVAIARSVCRWSTWPALQLQPSGRDWEFSSRVYGCFSRPR